MCVYPYPVFARAIWLLPKDAILSLQVGDHLLLLAIDPSGEQELQREGHHGDTPARSSAGNLAVKAWQPVAFVTEFARPSSGTLRDQPGEQLRMAAARSQALGDSIKSGLQRDVTLWRSDS